MRAVASGSMSAVFCSPAPPTCPPPTMFSIARMRVREWSRMRAFCASKLRHPELPASTTVVTPLRKVWLSAQTFWSSLSEPRSPLMVSTCVWMSTRPGVTYSEERSTTLCACGGDVRGHRRNAASHDGHIPDGVDVVLRIDDVPALEQQVVAHLRARGQRAAQQQRESHSHTVLQWPAEMGTLTRRQCFGALGLALPWRAAAGTAGLKVTRFDIHKVTLRWRDLVFLEVHTDGGITGLGEATLENRADMVEAGLRWLEEKIAGLDPSGIEDHWDRAYYRDSRWRNGPVANTALSAVDMALWDIEGKRLGVPVWRLLGGPIHRQLRVYFTHWHASFSPRSPESFAAHAMRARQQGWTAVKYTVPLEGPEAERIAQATAELEALRKAVGFSLDICLEAAESFSTRSAIQFACAVAPYRPLFLEEPTWRENPAALGEVAAASPVPIATGEGLFSRFEFRQLLEAKGAAIIQPDVLHAGGITELRKIAALAETFG